VLRCCIYLAAEVEVAEAKPQNVLAQLSRILFEPKAKKIFELSRLSRENFYFRFLNIVFNFRETIGAQTHKLLLH